MKIDIHTHILPPKWPDLRERYGYGGFVRMEQVSPCCAKMMLDDRFFREVDDATWSPERRIADCDKTGVTVQVLSTVPVMFSYWAKPEHTHDLSKLLNDHIAGVVREHPDRFVGFGTLPLQDPKRAVQELERCVKELNFPGVQIGSHVNGWNLDAPELFEVFEAAASLGAAVFVHPWDMAGRERMKKYWLPWLVGMPAETAQAICSVVFSGVLTRLPNLRMGFAHGGGSFPGTIGRIEHGFNVRPDLCAVDNQVSPRAHIGRFFVDSLVHDAVTLECLVKLLGADRVAMGSDYPFPLGEHVPGSLIESIDSFPRQVKEQLLFRTALEFLGIEEAALRAAG